MISISNTWFMQSRFLSHIHSAHYIMPESRYISSHGIDYSIAFYPLALIIIAYILIELHAHNFRVIVWIWRPFHRCFACFRQQWNIRTSIIDAFATFLILSNIMLLSVSFDLLTPTLVYDVNETVAFILVGVVQTRVCHLQYCWLSVHCCSGHVVFYSSTAASAKVHNLLETSSILSFLIGPLLFLYLGVIFLYWIYFCSGIGHQILVKGIMSWIKGVCSRVHGTGIEESLPDRLVNPSHYGGDDGDVPMASNGERFSEQTYSSISNDENSV